MLKACSPRMDLYNMPSGARLGQHHPLRNKLSTAFSHNENFARLHGIYMDHSCPPQQALYWEIAAYKRHQADQEQNGEV